MTERAQVRMERRDDTTVVIGIGELDLYIGREFGRTLADAVKSGQPVTVDLLSAIFIDSAILQAVGVYGKRLMDRGDRMSVLVKKKGQPGYVLGVVGFAAIMDVIACDDSD